MTTTAIISGSLSAIAHASGRSIAEAFVGCDAVLVVDVSGSMDVKDGRDGRSRYQVALEELATLQQSLPGKLAIVAFSDYPQFIPGGQPPLMGKGTDLAGALQFVSAADKVPGMRFILISDGEPNDQDAALRIARTFQNRIDVIYVGPEARPMGRDFLSRLAQEAGGQTITADRVERLAEKTILMLAG